ncbi:aldose 1-epimerase [Corynebacterium suranareeae]|uniref:glucose-6-phosphate 1-epimerase n=1 Tax=Corynebacterium suranareeae TaxID=2506452 RepID=A0A160PSF6_9CORY|nr:D-hexose-6-phosphate mutarotase [Corynebacterium suranareeae]BAU96656.1 aldose 1-epimerase [Corynebacterium suranareeae]
MTTFITSGGLEFSPAGAHIVHADSPEGELLYLSSATKFGEGNAIRGGVPLIAPWFGGLLGLEPSHGWARRSAWDVTDENGQIHASYGRDGLLLDVRSSSTKVGFEITMRLRNDTDEARTVQLAFHPYFKVEDVEKIEVRGLDGVDILDRLNDEVETQDGAITFEGEFDRIALGTPVVRIFDTERIITIEGDGHDSTVVWNPGESRASSMADIGDGEWRDFVCVEPALLGADQQGVRVAPGQSVTVGMQVSVEKRS